jgi:hypothetical protein
MEATGSWGLLTAQYSNTYYAPHEHLLSRQKGILHLGIDGSERLVRHGFFDLCWLISKYHRVTVRNHVDQNNHA